jgi:hypothetical protein
MGLVEAFPLKKRLIRFHWVLSPGILTVALRDETIINSSLNGDTAVLAVMASFTALSGGGVMGEVRWMAEILVGLGE